MAEHVSIGRMMEKSIQEYAKRPALWYEGQEMTYEELGVYIKKVANALNGMGIKKNDVIAIMLPNIPEFLYALLGAQHIGAVVVPVNPMFKGRELIHILNDSGAKLLVTLSNLMGSINEIRPDAKKLEHIVVVTEKRDLIYADPESNVFVQLVFEQNRFPDFDTMYHEIGEALVNTFRSFGIKEVWYKHKGGIRVRGKKIAGFTIGVIPKEKIVIVNSMCFLGKLGLNELFKVVFVPPEIKDRFIEPTTSIEEETGVKPTFEGFVSALSDSFQDSLDIKLIEDNKLLREEKFGYDKKKREFAVR